MNKPAYPHIPIAFLCASVAILLVGTFSDFGPPPPAGELLRGSVLGVERDGSGQEATAVVRVETTGGPVICGIDRAAFPDQRLPAPQSDLTVDYLPTSCAPAPVSRQLPRAAVLAMGGIGAALMVLWLRLGRRSRR
ncbi:hypothetical protein [Micromonospora vulcania]|uniref:DUF3592 domain-containing protein n=1 Tax=Micromonospora vulcania TaxID=1441873 RepID=A0ABW1H3C1_9ACTN